MFSGSRAHAAFCGRKPELISERPPQHGEGSNLWTCPKILLGMGLWAYYEQVSYKKKVQNQQAVWLEFEAYHDQLSSRTHTWAIHKRKKKLVLFWMVIMMFCFSPLWLFSFLSKRFGLPAILRIHVAESARAWFVVIISIFLLLQRFFKEFFTHPSRRPVSVERWSFFGAVSGAIMKKGRRNSRVKLRIGMKAGLCVQRAVLSSAKTFEDIFKPRDLGSF